MRVGKDKQKKINIAMNDFKKYLGAILVIIAAVILILSFFLGGKDYNGIQIGALVIMIAGILLHIFIGKKD